MVEFFIRKKVAEIAFRGSFISKQKNNFEFVPKLVKNW
jgi:hypothetical protein